MGEQRHFDVAVIGYGPVGATLANFLGKLGLSTCVIERSLTPYSLPRAGHFDDEVMRVWQTLGLSSQVAQNVRVNPGMRFVDPAGNVLINWPRPQEVGPQGWNTSYRFHQPFLEHSLREGVERFPEQEILLGREVLDIGDPHDDEVSIRYRNGDGSVETVTAQFVVGCDGGRSTVRQFMGVEMEDLGSHEKWLVVDVILKRPRDDLGDFTVQYCDPSRPTTYARCVGDRRRWELMVLPDDDEDTVSSPEVVWQMLSPWITPDDADIERATVYTFHGLLADAWRRGRLLLAGDAAHLMPPFLGQGMCSGIRDISNLAWKLEAVVRGKARDTLLDTYQQERSPHVREYVELAIRLGEFVQTRDPERARERDRELAENPQLLVSIKPRLGQSPLNSGAGPAGMLSEQVRLSGGILLDDAVGYRHALLLSSAFAGLVPSDVLRSFAEAGVAVLEGECDEYLARLDQQAIVIRPDRYILAGANSVEELKAALRLIETYSLEEARA